MKEKESEKKPSSKKFSPVAIIAVALVVLGGGYYLYTQKGSSTSKDSGTFSSIKDALSRSVSLECVYTDELGAQTTTYVKDGAIRINSQGADGVEPGGAIIKDNKMYTWSDETREGFIIKMQDTDTDETIEIPTSQGDKRAFIDALEAYRDNCKVTTVADSNFTPPDDIVFKDIASMFSGQNLPEDLSE